ncbi:MAG: alkaline phosphatase family protein [Acidimicrobiales bacterium]
MTRKPKAHRLAGLGAAGLALSLICGGAASLFTTTAAVAAPSARTPIQHVVIIFQENESFDHYFATYPVATNPAGEDTFTALPGSPSVNGLVADSLNGNTNLLSGNPNGANPQRLDPGPNASGVYNGSLDTHGSNAGIDDVLTCSQNHNYQPEQEAFDGGRMDKFPGSVGSTSSAPEPGEPACTANQDLDYYDGNTVTAYWNYAQHYALSDNSFGTTFGPSTPGAINAISGDTGNINLVNNNPVTPNALTSPNSSLVADGQGGFADINDADPFYDDCSSTTSNLGINNTSGTGVTDPNIGDLLNEAGLSWGWFQGGFTPTVAATGSPTTGYAGGPAAQSGKAVCGAVHNKGAALGGTGSTGAQPYGTTADYVQHHEPFQYYATTANPRHILPSSLSAIGTDTQSFTGGTYGTGTPEFNTANHQYDISYFNQLVAAIAQGTMPASSLPAVSYLKAPAYEDEHPSNSDPVDGQHFVTSEINSLMQTADWANTAVVVAYDDSDGWYDHVYAGNETGQSGAQNQSSAGGSPTLGDAENPSVCGGTPITGTALGSSTVITTGTNDTLSYTIGTGSPQTLTIPGGSYSPSALASAISTASSHAITAEVSSTNQLILTDNGLTSLTINSGDALASLGLTAASSSTAASPTVTNAAGQPENGRCGFGPRLPLLVISPYAKANFVDHTLSDQASIANFIEYNWGLSPIPGSADHLLTNPSTTFDLANMFDFSPGATDVAGSSPYYLDTATFQQTTVPSPVLPETSTPLLLPIGAGVILGGGALVVFWRRRRVSRVPV